jgi:hypothetical protein
MICLSNIECHWKDRETIEPALLFVGCQVMNVGIVGNGKHIPRAVGPRLFRSYWAASDVSASRRG